MSATKETLYAQSSKEELEQIKEDSLYQVALEDSLVRYEATKKAYQTIVIVHQLQNQVYEFAKKEWMFTKTLLELQIKQSENELQKQRKSRRREKIGTFLKGAAAGVVIGIVIAL